MKATKTVAMIFLFFIASPLLTTDCPVINNRPVIVSEKNKDVKEEF